MNRHSGEDSTSVIKAVLSSIKEWKKVGPYEIRAVMNSPNADLPSLLSTFQTKIIKNGSKGDGMGTGPFVMKEFSPGVKSISVRNENYWRKTANLDSIEVTAITDPVARINALIAGDMQIVFDVEPKAIRQIESADGVSLSSIPAGAYNGICALKNSMPGSNADFVKGLQFIQDRERIVNRVYKAMAQLVTINRS
ncbi:MAG: peptide/nickel transport system substrate-binding protein [Gammaproteobacteria bacterium]|jgi:peptide/nickel transport system substrate-binding protein